MVAWLCSCTDQWSFWGSASPVLTLFWKAFLQKATASARILEIVQHPSEWWMAWSYSAQLGWLLRVGALSSCALTCRLFLEQAKSSFPPLMLYVNLGPSPSLGQWDMLLSHIQQVSNLLSSLPATVWLGFSHRNPTWNRKCPDLVLGWQGPTLVLTAGSCFPLPFV